MKMKLLQSKSCKGVLLSLLLVISIGLYGCGEKTEKPDVEVNTGITVDELNNSTEDENQSQTDDENQLQTEDENQSQTDDVDQDSEEIEDSNSDDDKDTLKLKNQLEKSLKSLENTNEIYFEVTMSSSEMEVTTKTWMKDGMVRSEQIYDDELTITISDKEFVYSLNPKEKSGFKTPVKNDDLLGEGIMNSLTKERLDSIEQISVERYNGTECFVVVNNVMGISTKSWINKKTGFPLKAETKMGEVTYVIEYNDFKTGGISNKMFEVPSDYKITDFDLSELSGLTN